MGRVKSGQVSVRESVILRGSQAAGEEAMQLQAGPGLAAKKEKMNLGPGRVKFSLDIPFHRTPVPGAIRFPEMVATQ